MATIKDGCARKLAQSHSSDSSITKIIRLVSDHEGDINEPLKLLKVTAATVATGITPILWPKSNLYPFASVVVEVVIYCAMCAYHLTMHTLHNFSASN